jgi:FMN phosphatase YigB (HAD superfamily)
VIGTSDGWGAEKPSAAFFQRLIAEAGCPAQQVLYVGDRLDNDVRPAQIQGLTTAFLRRGPWGYILQDPEVLDRCLFRLDSLAELPDRVATYNAEVP